MTTKSVTQAQMMQAEPDLWDEDETDPRDVEWWNPSSAEFEVAYADEYADEEV